MGDDIKARLKTTIPGYEPGMPAHRMDDVTWMDELELMWGRKWGAQSSIGELRTVIVHRPGGEELGDEFSTDPVYFMNFGKSDAYFDMERKQRQHDEMVAALRSEGIEVIHANFPPTVKSIYTNKGIKSLGAMQACMVDGGAIIGRTAIAGKRGLERLWTEKLVELGCPILYSIQGSGIHEPHGNIVFLDPKHCIQATSVRSNMEGVRQVEPIMRMTGVVEFHVARLPNYLYNMERTGAGYAFHLVNVFSMVDERLAVIYPGGIDYDTIAYLRSKKIQLIEVPEKEATNMACNCMAVRPGVVIMAAGNPTTTAQLRENGVRVVEVQMTETARFGSGPICQINPLVRDHGPSLEG
ncbi:MAG: hypothetical protein HYU86_01055 [Chloroflexi bacterium]|nr:hypothetical protein [Chloroflexota bacterium]